MYEFCGLVDLVARHALGEDGLEESMCVAEVQDCGGFPDGRARARLRV